MDENLQPRAKIAKRKSAPVTQRQTSVAVVENTVEEPSTSDANFIIDLENIEYSLGINNAPVVPNTIEDDCVHLESMNHAGEVIKVDQIIHLHFRKLAEKGLVTNPVTSSWMSGHRRLWRTQVEGILFWLWILVARWLTTWQNSFIDPVHRQTSFLVVSFKVKTEGTWTGLVHSWNDFKFL